jgi:hypothetical protein
MHAAAPKVRFPTAKIALTVVRLNNVASPMPFRHPLARAAKVWTARGLTDGREHRVLVIVTTIPLDEAGQPHKKSLVDRLSAAAKAHLVATSEATSFVLVNRLRDWSRE